MSSSEALHLNAEDLVFIFIRFTVLSLAFYNLPWLVFFSGTTAHSIFLSDREVGELTPLFFEIAYGVVAVSVSYIIFSGARKLSKLIVGKDVEITFDGNAKQWVGLILQLIGISMVARGLASSGTLVIEIFRMESLGKLYNADSTLARASAEFVVNVGGGFLLLHRPTSLAKWMNSKR